MSATNARPRLESWKEIAGYLQRTVRTVQRWEENEGLPVHRLVHQALGNVYAFQDELDAWTAKRLSRPQEVTAEAPAPTLKSRRRIIILMAAAGAVVLAAVVWWMATRSSRPAEPAWLLVTALDNRTGEPLLDDSVPFLLEREISNSSGVYVASRARVEDTLKLMRKDPKTRIDEALGREVAIRDGGIRLVLSSRAVRAGSAYLLTVGVYEVSAGRLLGGASEQARTLEEIAPAVRHLATVARRAAGDRDTNGPGRDWSMQHVTTPSLRACQLYSQAFVEGQRGQTNAALSEKLVREALAEDPQFASAHIWLAHMILNQFNRPSTEWKPHLEQAVALSVTATDRERQFILGSRDGMEGKYDEAVLSWRRMLVSYPDDYWARNNLANALERTGRPSEAIVEWRRLADLRPNDQQSAFRVMSWAVLSCDLDLARKYRDRILRLADTNPAARHENATQSAAAFRLHELWLADKLDELRAEVDRLAQPGALGITTHSVVTFYEALGRIQDAKAAIEKGSMRPAFRVLMAYLCDDAAALRRNADLLSDGDVFNLPLLKVRADWTPEQLQKFLSGEKDRSDGLRHTLLAEGRYAALHGDLPTAVQKISEFDRDVPSAKSYREPFIVKAALARAYEDAGDNAGALRALQEADIPRESLFFSVGSSSVAFWHRIRYEEARLLRKLGRPHEAEPIEAGLRRDLRLADPDHPIVVRLRQSDRKPLSVY